MSKVMEKVRNGVDTEQLFGTDEYRNGFEGIRVSFRVKGDAPPEKLQEVVARAQRRSAVFDIVTNGVPVSVEAATS
jgi:uncharacterized OsmC-like protein